jgi:outer membrane protein assembly factor BamD
MSRGCLRAWKEKAIGSRRAPGRAGADVPDARGIARRLRIRYEASPMRLPALLAAVMLPAVLGGCDSFEIGGARHATLTYTDDARLAYAEAMKSFRAKEWDDARALFGEIKKLFTYSRYARLAELRLADIDFEQEKFSDAITAYREFVQNHKNDPDIEYARYKVTKALFKDIDDTFFLPPQEERDQATAFEAYREIKSFMRDYPRTAWFKDEQYMYEVVVGRLVRHELYVARYYLRIDNFDATVARVDYAIKAFPGSSLEPEALVLKGETLMKMKKLDEAREVFTLVQKSYGGPFAITAGKFLEEIKDLERKGRPGKPPEKPAEPVTMGPQAAPNPAPPSAAPAPSAAK